MSKISTIKHEIHKDIYRDAVEDDNIDQYIRDILELIKSQMPNGLIRCIYALSSISSSDCHYYDPHPVLLLIVIIINICYL